MFDPKHLDNCTLLEANEVLKLLDIKLVRTQLSPRLVIYNIMSLSKGGPIGIRWYLKSKFNIYSFSSPGNFMQHLFDKNGILEFIVWPDGNVFANKWRGNPYAFAITSVLSGCA